MSFNLVNLNLNRYSYIKRVIMELFSQSLNSWLLLTIEVLELSTLKNQTPYWA